MTGEFAYSSDLFMDDMIWGVTLRSPHPYARIVSVDIGPALATPGVHAVLTADDVPGLNAVGLEHLDQPVLAVDVVRYQGEPVALVAADHPETARRAAARIVVTYEPLEAVTDARRALDPTAPQLHEGGNVVRHLKIRKGDGRPGRRRSWSRWTSRSACRTRPSSGRSPGWRCPPRTAASTCTSPRSGCTWTSARSARRSTCPRRRCG